MDPISEIAGAVTEVAKDLAPAPINQIIEGVSNLTTTPSANSTIQTSAPTVDTSIPHGTSQILDSFFSCGTVQETSVLNYEKMILLDQAEWGTNPDVTHCLLKTSVPGAFFSDASRPAHGISKYFRLLRCGYRFTVVLSVPPGACGAVAMVFVPPGFNNKMTVGQTVTKWDPEAVLTLPHVVVDSRTSNAGTLTVPYVNYQSYCNLEQNGNQAFVAVLVLGKYNSGTGTSSTCDIALYGELLDTDFQCPRPVSQGRRRKASRPEQNPTTAMVSIASGPGSANLANSTIAPRLADSLAIANEGTAVDYSTAGCDQSVNDIIELARSWQLAAYGKLNSADKDTVILNMNFVPYSYGNLGLLFDKFQYWRGSLEVQFVMYSNSLASGRYQLCWFPADWSDSSRAYTLAQLRNSIYATGDVSSAPCTLVLPFTNQNWRRRCDSNYGSITVRMVNRLAVNGSSTTHFSYALFVRAGQDLQFFAPRYGDYSIQQGPIEGETYNQASTLSTNFEISDVVIHGSKHTQIDNYFGRAWVEGFHTSTAASTAMKLPLQTPRHSHGSAMLGFAYWCGEVVITVHNRSQNMLICAHSYDLEEQHSQVNEQSIFSLGAILVPPREVKTFRAPWYSQTPLRRPLDDPNEPSMGFLYVSSEGTSDFTVYLALHKPKFFFPLPCPMFTSNQSREAPRQPKSIAERKIELSSVARRTLEWARREVGAIDETDHKDILLGGDIEENPGPQSVYLLGLSGCGKSRLINAIAGHPLCDSRLSPNPIHTETHSHQLMGYEIFEQVGMPPAGGKYVYLQEATRFDKEHVDYIREMDKLHPGWRRHAVLYVNRLGDTKLSQYLRGVPELAGFKEATDNPLNVIPLLVSIDTYVGTGVQLVCKNRGVYKHFGVREGDKVYHINTENLVKTALDGEVAVMVEDYSDGWIPCSPEEKIGAVSFVQTGTLDGVTFSCDFNCETWAKIFVPSEGETQGQRLKKVMAIAAGAAFVYGLPRGEGFDFMQCVTKVMMTLFSKQVKTIVVKMVIKFFCRLCCYLVLYCHSPNLVNTAMLTILLTLDVFDTEIDEISGKVAKALVSGDFKAAGRAMMEAADRKCEDFKCEGKRTLQSEGPDATGKSFNTWTLVAKNLEWWVDKLKQFINWIRTKLFPSDARDKIEAMESVRDRMVLSLAAADKHLVTLKADKAYATSKAARDYHLKITNEIIDLNAMDLGPDFRDLGTKIGQILNRLQSVTFDSVDAGSMRQEPLGIWISGEPGCGKSFLSHLIIKHLKEKKGFSVFCNPSGSDHMDGYNGQEIHYFDDLGQIREEADIKLMCQLISSQQFIVPKADLTSKGTLYNAKVVIATTNKNEFDSTVLNDSGALRRRFPIRLHVRPHSFYSTQDGRLDLNRAMKDGDIDPGCWEINVGTGRSCWQTLNWDILIHEVEDELINRENINKFFSQGAIFESDEVEVIPEQGPGSVNKSTVTKLKNWINSLIDRAKSFFERNKCWFYLGSALATLATLVTTALPAARNYLSNLYSGEPTRAKVTRVTREFQSEGPSYYSLKDRLVEVGETGSTGLALGGKVVLSFGHNDDSKFITYKDQEHPVVKEENISVNNSPQDLALLTVQTPYQFKEIRRKIYADVYSGDGFLLFLKKGTLIAHQVKRITPCDNIMTQQGHQTQFAYRYQVNSASGWCGGVLVGIVGGNPMILGMHVAGNGSHGIAARIFPNFSQGIVTQRMPNTELYFQPRRSEIYPSPANDGTSSVEPPVLSNRDKRLEEPIDDITKHNADRHKMNRFNPPMDAFQVAKANVISELASIVAPCYHMTYDQVVDSSLLPIDWTTSPGLEFKGKTKKQLIDDPAFKERVMKLYKSFAGGNSAPPQVKYTTYLKDEVRSKEKVKKGATRTITASSFDYTIACRMIFGNIFRQLFGNGLPAGFAPGMNPYTQFDELYDSCRLNVICLDYSKFDASLSKELMEHAIEVVACFSEDPMSVIRAFQPTLISQERVSDELWEVRGSMPSGSPWTTMINTICNLLMCKTYLLDMGHDITKTYVVCYGDDCVISVDQCHRLEGIEQWFMDKFGATVTPEDKSGKIKWRFKNKLKFLKRTPMQLDWLPKIVGALDIDSMMDRIQWTKGHFQEQLNCFYYELALHGEDTYNEARRSIAFRCPELVHPTYHCALETIKPMVSLM
ncbi:polyprotein [Turkey avisivirus]|uniref:Genome polyprotein n=10 Tax=Avisivirus A TaxID=1511772 RepID=M4PJD6_9PICO|nr:polyprotein [Turkey avisivirus]AGH06056.1 polyprotein [avisivirus A1]